MTLLARIADDYGRSQALVQSSRRTGERLSGQEAGVRQIERGTRALMPARSSEIAADYVDLTPRRQARSLPSSAFFAQYIGQQADDRDGALAQSTADIAYRDALDLGVSLYRPTPVSLAV